MSHPGEWKVTLLRQPWHDNVTYKHINEATAKERAYTLSKLHNQCQVAVIRNGRRIWVYAAAYYARKEP